MLTLGGCTDTGGGVWGSGVYIKSAFQGPESSGEFLIPAYVEEIGNDLNRGSSAAASH